MHRLRGLWALGYSFLVWIISNFSQIYLINLIKNLLLQVGFFSHYIKWTEFMLCLIFFFIIYFENLRYLPIMWRFIAWLASIFKNSIKVFLFLKFSWVFFHIMFCFKFLWKSWILLLHKKSLVIIIIGIEIKIKIKIKLKSDLNFTFDRNLILLSG